MTTYWDQLFATVPRKTASRCYCIVFTPRSGSTWLGDLLSNSGYLGRPQEWFNPDPARKTALESEADDLNAYYLYLKQAQRTGDVFGLEITWPQMDIVLQSVNPVRFEDMRVWAFLRRRDFVAQAVSLFKAESTGRFHSVQGGEEGPAPDYAPLEIARNVRRLMAQEFACEHFFKSRKIEAIELWYEDLLGLEPEQVLGLFSSALALPEDVLKATEASAPLSRYRKMGGADNELMAARFRRDYAEPMKYWEEYRGSRSVKSFLQEFPDYQHRF